MNNFESGSWEVDEHGRRFRRIGPGAIEYQMTVSTGYGTFPIGEVPKPKATEAPKPKAWGTCPFNSKCSQNCARYTETGCGIVTGAAPAIGRRCPFGDKVNPTRCSEDCAFWTMCGGKEQ